MNELESGSRARGDAEEPRRAAEINEDLQALRASTSRELPPLDRYVTRARHRLRAPVTLEERFMATIRLLKGRPWLTTAVAAAVMAIVMLVVPVSYQRTSGHDVALTVEGAELGTAQISNIARGLEAVLGIQGVRVEAEAGGDGASYAFTASVPEKPGRDVARLAEAYAKGLQAHGYTASIVATPRSERVWGTMYAYARDRVIRISVDGKSAAELEAEIRQRLAEAGVTNAQVSVTDEGDGQHINVELEHQGTSSTGGTLEEAPEIEITRNGAPMGQVGCAVKVKKRTEGTTTVLDLEVIQDGRSTNVQITDPDSKSDAVLAAEIESQLRSAGFDLKVTVEQGKIRIGGK